MVRIGNADSTLTTSLRYTIDENIPPDLDLYPRVRSRLMASAGSSRRRLAAAVVVAAFLLSAGVAVAQSDSIRVVITKLDPASVRGPIPRASETVSLGDAERRAEISVLRPVEGAGIRLLSVEILAPITEIEGRPVRDPRPTVRLVYRVGETNATVDQVRNPNPDRPMELAIVGSTENVRVEDDGGVQRSYAYTPDGNIHAALWATREVWVVVSFNRPIGSDLGHEFVRSFK